MIFQLETTHILDALGMAILHSLWQVAIAAAIVFLCYKITNSKQARQRYFVSYSMLLLSFFGFVFTFLWSLPIAAEEAKEVLATSDLTELAMDFVNGETALLGNESQQSFYETITAQIGANTDWIGFLWVIGFVFYAIKYIVAFRLSIQLRTVGVREVEEYWQRRIRELIAETKINEKTEMMYSQLVENPLTIGFFKPLILVPSGFLMNLPPEQVEAVLLHEIAHIRRYDYVFNLIQTFVKTVFFYHPGVRFISNKIDIEREHLCDDFAVGRTDDPTALAKALGFLQLNSFNKQNSFAMNAVKRNHPFLDRLKRLFGQEEQAEKMKKSRVVLPILILLLAVFATTAYTDATPTVLDKMDDEESENFRTEIDTVPPSNESNVWVEKKEERIIVTEKDGGGNERKLIKETLGNGEERVSAFLNGAAVEVDEEMLAMVPPPPPVPPVPPHAPNPELYEELSELARIYAEKRAQGIEDEEALRKLEILGRLAAVESLKNPKNTDPFSGLNALGEFDDIAVVFPPMPPIPPIPPLKISIDLDSLPEGVDEEEFERYIEQIELEAERIEEMAEEFQEKYGRVYEEAIERSMEKQEDWLRLQEQFSEEKMREFEQQQEEAARLFEEQHHIFEQQLHERTHELENLSEQLENRFPQLFMDVDIDGEHLENLFERSSDEDHVHEDLGDLDEEDLKELRNELREMLAEDGLIKSKKKKATIQIINDETYLVNGKRMTEKQWEKYHDFFHENEMPHENGMEIRIHKNVFQVGREEGNAFRGLTVFF